MNAPASLRLLASRRCFFASFFCAYKREDPPYAKTTPRSSSLDPLSPNAYVQPTTYESFSLATMSGSPLHWPSDSDTPSDEDNHPERRKFWERDDSPPKPRPRARRSRAGDDSPPPADDSPPLAVSGEEVEARLDELERLEARDLHRQERAEKSAANLVKARAKKKEKKRAEMTARVEAKVAAEEAAKRAAPSDDDDGAGTSAKKQKIE